MSDIKRIAVFTSGGDAPGMNAAIRAVVRTAAYHDLHVYGINCGYQGMVESDIERLEARDVANIIQRGGTILKTARSQEFMTAEGRAKAYEALKARRIDACVAIGGDGTYTGAKVFTKEYEDIPFIGLPGTIDNDIYGTDFTIGYDTAINTAIEAVDRIRDTADSHNRLFFVEVMGRHAGFIALSTGIGGGAGAILVPETDTSIDDLCDLLKKGKHNKKLFSIVIVAEGNKNGGAFEIAEKVKEKLDHSSRVAIIGHLQRGGSPTALDRLLASRLGFEAVEQLLAGKKNVALGLVNNEITFTSFDDAVSKHKPLNKNLLRMADVLAV